MASQDRALTWYTTQSRFSDPGDRAAMLDTAPSNLRDMRNAITPLVFHYVGDGDWAENGIDQERRPEIDLRYADAMLGRLAELSPKPLGEHRLPHERIVGCCRDFTLLFVSLLRHKGIPSRSRVGFAGYFFAEWKVDHVVAEVWDSVEQRWRLIDPEIGTRHTDPTDGAELNALDLPRDRFIVAPDAWLRCREGRDDPDTYLVSPFLEVPDTYLVSPFLEVPDTRSWPYLLHNLVHDLAALNKQEMILWDDWGLSAEWESITDDQRTMLDEAARAMLAANVTVEDLQRLYEHDAFRVPKAVTSWTSAAENPPIEVVLR